MLLIPPHWLNFAAINNIALSPTNSDNITGTMQGSENQETRLKQAINASESDLKGFLNDIAIKYGQNYEKMEAVITCESGFRTDVYSAGKISYGIAQFTKPTFLENCKGDYYSPYDQMECMGKMWSRGLERRWDCYRILYL